MPLHAATVGGTLRSNTVWGAGQSIQVTNHLAVPANITLTMEAGVQVQIGRNLSITAQSGGTIDVVGTAANPVLIRPLNGTNDWRSITADGTDARLTMRHADVAQGQTLVLNGASGLFEFCRFHDYSSTAKPPAPNQPIFLSTRAGSMRVRACHFQNYYETLFQSGVFVIEDSLFEDVTGDGIDFDTASPGSVIRRCTIRRGTLTNVDAVDLGSGSRGVVVENCLMHDFPADKGVSIGERSTDITVRGCVIYGVDIGVAVKDSSVAEIVNNTIVDSTHGVSLYEKISGQGGGSARAWNNILWNNANSISVENGSMIAVTFSDISGAEIYPGAGNVIANPAFRNDSSRDYRLAPGSLAIGSGADGATMGAQFPVGSFLVDTDRDGVPDTWEMIHDLDFNSPADASVDSDGDGFSNLREYSADTNPWNPSSVLRAGARVNASGNFALVFSAAAGKAYRIEFRDSLAAGGWQTLTEVPPVSSEQPREVQANLTSPARFFRVVVVQAH